MPKAVSKLALSDGRLAAGDTFGNIKVWNIAEQKLLAVYPVNIEGQGPSNLVFQPNGSKLVLTRNRLLLIFDLDNKGGDELYK